MSVTAAAAAPIAPLVEPPAAFGHVAPGVYRCDASSLTKGLPPAPKGWKPTQPVARGESSRSNATMATGAGDTSAPGAVTSSNGNSSSASARYQAAAALNSPTEAFLFSLQLRTILFLAPERKPSGLAAWCASQRVQLVHFGLGALADQETLGSKRGSAMHGAANNNSLGTATTTSSALRYNNSSGGVPLGALRAGVHPNDPNGRSSHTSWETHGGTGSADMISLERIAKDSLELLLDQKNLPCLICDMSGVNETGVVVGCLRRLQRFNFASIRLEYRSYAGSRARSSHERFIEMFDTDLISVPPTERLPLWFADQVVQDEEDEMAARNRVTT